MYKLTWFRVTIACSLCVLVSPLYGAKTEHMPASTADLHTTLSPARCARLALDLQHIRQQFRRGYSIRQQVQLEQKQDKLRLALQYQCEPINNTGLQSRHTSQQAGPPKANRSDASQPKSHQSKAVQRTKPLQISVVNLTAPYQGKQLQAWLAFYQSPFYCYNVRATERIRQCVEQRQAAQRRFEQHWLQQNLSDQ